MLPIAYSIRLTRQSVLCLGLLVCLLVSGYQQAKCPSACSVGARASWIVDEPAAQELLSLTDDEAAATDRRTVPQRLRKAILETRTVLRRAMAFATETTEKDFAATLAAYAQQYARYVLPPGYYLFLFRYTPF